MSSEFFTIEELTRSATARERGINNIPTGAMLERLEETARYMDTVRRYLGYPIIVSSAYRGPALNSAVGGSTSSDHMKAYAVDFTCPRFGNPRKICLALRDSGIRFDQLINEFGQWVHISRAPAMRQQSLTAVKQNGRTAYVAGIR